MATAFAVAVRRAGRGADVLALMPEAGGALPDLEAAGFAEIVPPRIDAAAHLGFFPPKDCERMAAGAFSSGKRICE